MANHPGSKHDSHTGTRPWLDKSQATKFVKKLAQGTTMTPKPRVPRKASAPR